MKKSSVRFASHLNQTLNELDTVVRDAGVPATQQVINGAFSQENLPAFRNEFDNQLQGVRQQMAELLGDIDPEFAQEELTEGQYSQSMRAGLIALLASQNLSGYHRQALAPSSGDATSLESLANGIGGQLEFADARELSQESFDTTQLANFTAQNIMFNVLASRQNAFAEAFFPTKVMSPSEGGIEITVDQQQTLSYKTHKSDGTMLGLERKNLMDAFVDHEIISEPATELVPYRKPDNSTDTYFVSDNWMTDVQRTVQDVTVTTRPLKIGKRVNFMGLSQHPGLMDNGVLDFTDQIAPGAKLNTIYLGLFDENGANPAIYETLAFDVSNMGRNQFKKSYEGSGREVILNFTTDSLIIDPTKTTIDGVNPGTIADLVHTPGKTVQLSVQVHGNGNLESGSLEVIAGDITVHKVFDTTGEPISLESGDGLDIVNRLEARDAKIIGYDLSARRSNSNWRSVGTIIDVTPYTESFAIEPGYPISVLTPTDENQNGAKISGMVNAARIRNSNNAVTMLFNYAEQLDAYKSALNDGARIDIIGAARHIVKPFYENMTVDISARVVTISSYSRFTDISRVIVDAIRDLAYRMYRDSNYGSALDVATSGTNTKPIVLIGCDQRLEKYINVEGDSRLLGEGLDHRVISTPDKRMDGKVFVTFTREAPGSEDGLSFGVHAFVPELIQRVNVNRQGSTTTNDRVIPRSIHVPVLPILGDITFTNLDDAVAYGT